MHFARIGRSRSCSRISAGHTSPSTSTSTKASKHDTENRLSVGDDKVKYLLIQWLSFQASCQGCVSVSVSLSPYHESMSELTRPAQPILRPGVLPVVHELPPREATLGHRMYQKETLRVLSVLNAVHAEPESGGRLVGAKPTVADLSFITWSNAAVNITLKGYGTDVEKAYPALFA